MTALVRASVAHAEAMAAIHALAFPPNGRWGAATMAQQLGMPGVFGWLAGPAGFVLTRVAADEAEILTLAVVPAQQRQGLGHALFQKACDQARAEGAVAILLEVAVGNAAALAMYRGAGLAEVGRRRDYYAVGADALVLRGTLNRSSV